MKTLVIGNSSAGRRHKAILTELGHEVRLVSASPPIALHGEEYAVIASLTTRHAEHLKELESLGFTGKCLVEKPLFMKSSEAYRPSLPVYVAYQLRFHPAIKRIRKALQTQIVQGASALGYQHKRFWKGTRIGVLRDYSHELDLINWLCGVATKSSNAMNNNKNMVGSYLRMADGYDVAIGFNYFNDPPVREFSVRTNEADFTVDLTKANHYELTRLLHKDILSGATTACTYDEGLAVNRLIDMIEA